MNKEKQIIKEINYKVKYIDKCAELDIKKAELVLAIKSSAEKRQRINKAIEYIEGVNYNNKVASAYEENNTTKCTKKELIELEIKHNNYILSILRGEDNESIVNI